MFASELGLGGVEAHVDPHRPRGGVGGVPHGAGAEQKLTPEDRDILSEHKLKLARSPLMASVPSSMSTTTATIGTAWLCWRPSRRPAPASSIRGSSKVRGAAAALQMIEPLAGPLAGYFHYFGVKGALLKDLGRANEARQAFNQAVSLARTAAEAAHIRMNLDRLDK